MGPSQAIQTDLLGCIHVESASADWLEFGQTKLITPERLQQFFVSIHCKLTLLQFTFYEKRNLKYFLFLFSLYTLIMKLLQFSCLTKMHKHYQNTLVEILYVKIKIT